MLPPDLAGAVAALGMLPAFMTSTKEMLRLACGLDGTSKPNLGK
jgi:hypothetical protein